MARKRQGWFAGLFGKRKSPENDQARENAYPKCAVQTPQETTRPKPGKFRVWFRSGRVDQMACARAVRAWVDGQKAEGIRIQFDPAGATGFEVEPNVMPGIDEVSFLSGLKLMLQRQGDQPDLLFYHADVAIYPCYRDQVEK